MAAVVAAPAPSRLAAAMAVVAGQARQLSAFLAAAAILNVLGALSYTTDTSGPLHLQALADSLHSRWGGMAAQGVPSRDLVRLQAEWARDERVTVLGVGSVFWKPGSNAIVDRWQAQTDAVWNHNLGIDRTGAAVSEQRLHSALGTDPLTARKERMYALASAATPAEFMALGFEWELEARLVPIDRTVAGAVAAVTDSIRQAGAIGIVSTPAADYVARMAQYPDMDPHLRQASAGFLLGQMNGLQSNLQSRIAAATAAHDGFARVSGEISQADNWGVTVSGYQAQVSADAGAYAIATTPAQFNAIAADVNQVASAAHAAALVAMNATHVIYGVQFYYQVHSLSCEETATSMGLTHQGLYISQDQILAGLGVDSTPAQVVNGVVVKWGNPDRAFVGNVNGSENNFTGQQANPKALMRVLNSYGARVIDWSEPGVTSNVISAQEIYSQIAAGHPVVAYATWDWRWHPIYYYTSEDGNQVPLIAPANDHVYLVIGVSQYGVLVNDPIRGQYWVSKGEFESSYEFGMAIVLA